MKQIAQVFTREGPGVPAPGPYERPQSEPLINDYAKIEVRGKLIDKKVFRSGPLPAIIVGPEFSDEEMRNKYNELKGKVVIVTGELQIRTSGPRTTVFVQVKTMTNGAVP